MNIYTIKERFHIIILLFFGVCTCRCSADFINNENKPKDIIELCISSGLQQQQNNKSFNVNPSLLNKFIRFARKDKTIDIIIPLTSSSDTLAYYVQYSDNKGWEILASDKRLDPVLSSSPCGNLNFSDQKNPAINVALGMVKNVLNTRNANLQENRINPLWLLLQSGSPSVCNSDDRQFHQDSNKVYNRGEFTTGMWIGVDTTLATNITYSSPRLIETQWNQDSPWNWYTPFRNWEHSPVGCMPVAVGQILYKYYHNNPGSFYIYKHADVPINGGDVVFDSLSLQPWASMAKKMGYGNVEYTGIFLSWLGQEMGTNYGTTQSHTNYGRDKSLLNQYVQYNTLSSFSNNQNTYNTIFTDLVNGNPIYVAAHADTSGHCFIIDAYETESLQYIVRYVFDPDHVVTEDEFYNYPSWMFDWPVNGDPYKDNIETESVTDINKSYYIKMNWGLSNSNYNNYRFKLRYETYAIYLDNTYYSQSDSYYAPYWTVGQYTYSTMNYMLYNIHR